jgi:hypothetical protein
MASDGDRGIDRRDVACIHLEPVTATGISRFRFRERYE